MTERGQPLTPEDFEVRELDDDPDWNGVEVSVETPDGDEELVYVQKSRVGLDLTPLSVALLQQTDIDPDELLEATEASVKNAAREMGESVGTDKYRYVPDEEE